MGTRRKYNNGSPFFRDWTVSYLKRQALAYDEIVNGPIACFGTKDMMMLQGICRELERRGIEVHRTLRFS